MGKEIKAVKKIPNDDEIKIRKKRRFKPGTVAIRKIRHYQKDGRPLLQRAPLVRLIREIMRERSSKVEYITADAIELIQEYVEAVTIEHLEKSQILAIDNKRIRVKKRDFQFVRSCFDKVR